jgi:Zn-dependent protease
MREPDRRDSGTGWTVSPSFLALIAVLLGLAVLMVARPDFSRWAVFPFVLAGWVVSLCLHEFGHALAAFVCGDRSVRDKGYLTLDPLHYTDLQFSILLPLVFLAMGGIGLPGGAVYVDVRSLSRLQRAIVSAAGPLATLAVMILLLAILHGAEGALAATPALRAALAFLAFLQLTALVLNLLPIPGLDGWGIIAPALPRPLQALGARMAGIAAALLFVAFFLIPAVNEMFWRVVFDLCALAGLDAREAIGGLRLFQFWR